MKAEALDNNRLDRWLQRGAVATMVAVAVTLVGIGIAIYAKPLSPSAVEVPRNIGNQVGPGTDKVTLTSTTSR